MAKTIQLTLIKSLIIDAVKSETFFRGQVAKAVDQKAITEAYHEQAGDDAYQERLLERALYTNLEDLKTHLSDYLNSEGGSTTADNNIGSEVNNDTITITLYVSDRFNDGFTESLARLSSKYIEESMLMDWWKPVNEKQSALYAQFVERDLAAIKRCFNKTAPSAPTVPYTQVINTTGTTVELETGETASVTYSLTSGVVDDVECRVADASICTAVRGNGSFYLTGNRLGHTTIVLYSRHNTSITRTIDVYVTDHT